MIRASAPTGRLRRFARGVRNRLDSMGSATPRNCGSPTNGREMRGDELPFGRAEPRAENGDATSAIPLLPPGRHDRRTGIRAQALRVGIFAAAVETRAQRGRARHCRFYTGASFPTSNRTTSNRRDTARGTASKKSAPRAPRGWSKRRVSKQTVRRGMAGSGEFGWAVPVDIESCPTDRISGRTITRERYRISVQRRGVERLRHEQTYSMISG